MSGDVRGDHHACSEPDEDSWTALGRLADEHGWRPAPAVAGSTLVSEPVVVDTGAAAEAVGVAASGFTTWARRRGLRPLRHERRGRRTVALWELQAVLELTRRR